MSDTNLCSHIHDNGQPCAAFRVQNTPYCYFHRKYYQPAALPGERNYQAPLLESHQSITLASTHLLQSFLTGRVALREAQFALNILRLASRSITAIERANKEKEQKQQDQGDGRRSPSTGSKSMVEQQPTAATAAVQACAKAAPTATKAVTDNPKPPQSAAPAYKGDRYFDPCGCLAPMMK